MIANAELQTDSSEGPNLSNMRIVSLLVPVPSGMYVAHCSLSRSLAQRGCSTTWLCSGLSNAQQVAASGIFPADGEIVSPETDNLNVRTRALIKRISEISPDVLMCHALGDPSELNAVRYLPDSIHRILVVHSTSIATYRGASAVREYVDAAVAISPRIKEDLIYAYGFREESIHLIPNGINESAYSNCASSKSRTSRLRILSHGRIAKDKGVFLIPEILSRLDRHSDQWECTISGDGPVREELVRRLVRFGLSKRVRFIGWTASADVPELMSQHDVLLFPTVHEGFGTVLVEAMAGGCVPIASRLPGVTDWIIEDGRTGLLFPVRNVGRAVQHLLGLLSNRRQLAELRQRVLETAGRFSMGEIAEQYHRLLSVVQTLPQQTRSAEYLDTCELADGLRPAWWYGLPEPIKDQLRLIRETIRTFVRIP